MHLCKCWRMKLVRWQMKTVPQADEGSLYKSEFFYAGKFMLESFAHKKWCKRQQKNLHTNIPNKKNLFNLAFLW